MTGIGRRRHARTTVPRSPHSPTDALTVGCTRGLVMIVAGTLIVRIFLRPPEGEVTTLLLSLLKEMGGMYSCSAFSCGSLQAIQCGIWQSWTHSLPALHSDPDATPVALDTTFAACIRYLCGALCSAARNSRFALLAEPGEEAPRSLPEISEQ